MAANGNKQVAADFEKIIHNSRDRKKNEALAARIFDRNRRSSTPASNGNKASGAGSLASRAGIKKPAQQQRAANKPRHSTSNIDGEWTHDLHEDRKPPRGPKAAASPAPNSLAARITDSDAPVIPTGPRQQQKQKCRAAQVAQALTRTELQHDRKPNKNNNHQNHNQRNGGPPKSAPTGSSSFNRGIQIRGLAGPYVVMAHNFAPGTTEADIESAMTPVGGIITSCRILKQLPIVVAEVVFESKEGADNAIANFNNQTADGQVLSVYHKVPNVPSSYSATSSSTRRIDDDAVVDGSWGFDEPMEVDHGGNGRAPPTGLATGINGGLYSDGLVGGGTKRWGRGFNHGR